MKFQQIRNEFSDRTTISDLVLDEKNRWYILEDKDRGLRQDMKLEEIERLKQYGVTCIPYGDYEVKFTFSNRFKIILPLYDPVKGYAGIRFHPGINEHDTLGCLLPGKKKLRDQIQQSRIAFYEIMEKMLAYKTGDIYTAQQMVELYKKFFESKKAEEKAKLSAQVTEIYNSKKIDANRIYWFIVKATANVIHH